MEIEETFSKNHNFTPLPPSLLYLQEVDCGDKEEEQRWFKNDTISKYKYQN